MLVTLNSSPQAVRRVKSMVIHQDLEDGMAVGKRMFVLQQKRNNAGSVTSVPSPLLSSQDVSSLKVAYATRILSK